MRQQPRATVEEIAQEREVDRLERLGRIAQARPWPGAPEEEAGPLQVTMQEAAGPASPIGNTPRRSLKQITQERETAAERAARARWQELWERTHREGGRPYVWTERRRPRPVTFREGDMVALSPGDPLAWCVTRARVLEVREGTVLLRPEGWPGGALERRPDTLTKLPRRGAPVVSGEHSGGER